MSGNQIVLWEDYHLFTIEHGHANDQSNDFSSVAYWYQLEPHKPLKPLPEMKERLPKRWPEHGLWDK
ncbi:hypothetical protein ACFFHM_17795 [Halalkalibacter kiskunsagensis]|uniref:DUF2961 domain-containing protein n=1 Tax=Halalkalibacter kiskunsagensis TaxID=1548599 RepID=A0ABV6KKD1_9BACI